MSALSDQNPTAWCRLFVIRSSSAIQRKLDKCLGLSCVWIVLLCRIRYYVWNICHPLSFCHCIWTGFHLSLIHHNIYITYQVVLRLGLRYRCSSFFQKVITQRATLPCVDNHYEDHRDRDDFPDRVAHPELYEPLVQSAERQGKRYGNAQNINEEIISLYTDYDTNNFPDRVVHPEQYEPLLPSAERQ